MKRIIAIAIAVLLAGCATSTGGGKLDPCEAMRYAVSGNDIAKAASSIVCGAIPDKAKRDKCFEYQALASRGGDLLIGVASTVLKQCTVK